MATPTTQSPLFVENLRAPGWVFAFLGLMLGGVSGGLTAVGIRSLAGEPLVSGSEALIFYICFAIAIVGIVYVMLNSTLMETRATAEGDNSQIGRPRHSTRICLGHDNRGSRIRPQHRTARRTWQPVRTRLTSVLDDVRGKEWGGDWSVTDGDGDQIVFVSSRVGGVDGVARRR